MTTESLAQPGGISDPALIKLVSPSSQMQTTITTCFAANTALC
jgi:hypothetical protein